MAPSTANITASYIRVSTDEQVTAQTHHNQIDFARKYADLHQIGDLALYVDEGVTGTIPLDQRPEGARLLSDARAGQIGTLLVYRLDRLGRSPRVILNAVHELEQHGVTVKSMTEPFDTSNPSGRFLLTILAAVAGLERETIIERMSLGAARAAREGRWLGGIVPYGYRVTEKYLQVCEDRLPGLELTEAGVVRLIYQLLADERYTCAQIADYLNALGIPPAYTKDGRQVTRGKRKVNTSGYWTPGRIRNMVVMPTYRGEHEYGRRSTTARETILRAVPAIVTPEQWERAQKALQLNYIDAFRNRTREYLLRGLITCESCGHRYCGTAMRAQGGTVAPYYVCTQKTRYLPAGEQKCRSKNLPGEWIEGLVWQRCVEFLTDPAAAVAAMRDYGVGEEARSPDQTERDDIARQLTRQDGERERILDLYRRGVITTADVESQLARMKSEGERLQARLREIDQAYQEAAGTAAHWESLETLLESLRAGLRDDLPIAARREIVRALVPGIRVETVGEGSGRWHVGARVTVTYLWGSDEHLIGNTERKE